MPVQRFEKITSKSIFVSICNNLAPNNAYAELFATNDRVNFAPGDAAFCVALATSITQPWV